MEVKTGWDVPLSCPCSGDREGEWVRQERWTVSEVGPGTKERAAAWFTVRLSPPLVFYFGNIKVDVASDCTVYTHTSIERIQAVVSQQRNPCTDCKSAQWCTSRGQPSYHSPKLHPGPCSSVGMRRGADRHTDGRGQYTFCLGYASREM